MPDAVEPVRQGVQQEAANELVGGKGHELCPAVVAVILPAEGDRGIGNADEAGVGDGHAVSISAEIGEHLCGAAERRLGIHHRPDPSQVA